MLSRFSLTFASVISRASSLQRSVLVAAFEIEEPGAHMKRWNADRSANEIGSNRAAPKLSLRPCNGFFHFMEKSLVNELQRRLSGLFHKHSIRRTDFCLSREIS